VKQLIIFVFVFTFITTKAQVTIGTGDHVVEIGGVFSTYLNFRTIKEEATNQNKNKDRFKLRDARFFIEGRIENKYEYKIQADLSSLGASETDPESPALYDAYIKYKGFKPFNITVGYGKLPYSRASLVAFTNSPYWQRAEVVRGDLFSRRDVGVTLDQSLWNNRINVYAGAYTGTGEVFWQGDNDPSGAFEYIGRIDFSYPSRYRYQDIDTRVSPVPMISIGTNARYSKRDLPVGETFITGEAGPYGIKVIDGKRLGIGIDASFQYKGFSAQFETQQLKATPNNAKDPNLRGLPKELTKGYFKSGGWIAQANYFIQPAKTIVSGRYEQLDLNDLVPGNSRRLSAAVAYQLNGSRSMIKAQYFKILKEESIDPLRWTEQFRIGWQLALN
jgi:Phosphate-selective porin O and P